MHTTFDNMFYYFVCNNTSKELKIVSSVINDKYSSFWPTRLNKLREVILLL